MTDVAQPTMPAEGQTEAGPTDRTPSAPSSAAPAAAGAAPAPAAPGATTAAGGASVGGAAPTGAALPARRGTEGMSPTELGVARAAALFERVDPAEAAALLENVLKLDPESAAGWILMARIRLVLDQVDPALDAAAKAIELAPEDPRPLATASRALTLKGRHEEAVTMAYRAVIADPRNPLWQDRVAWALLAADRQIADAEQAARTAIGLDPNEAHYYFTHGVTLDALGHADQARQALLISLRLEPDNPVAQHRLAVLNGEIQRATEPKKRRWKLFGRGGDTAARSNRPEEYL